MEPRREDTHFGTLERVCDLLLLSSLVLYLQQNFVLRTSFFVFRLIFFLADFYAIPSPLGHWASEPNTVTCMPRPHQNDVAVGDAPERP